MRSLRHLPALLVVLAAASPAPSELVIVTDEAEAAIHILESRQAGRAVADESWRRLFATEGYRRLKARETAMGRGFEDSSFRAFLLSDTLLPRTAALRKTLLAWRNADLGTAGAKAIAYLPGGTRLRARVYLLIKPRSNSFVFEAQTNPAIMLYLDPAQSRDQLENTIAHELHHIGYAAACPSTCGGWRPSSSISSTTASPTPIPPARPPWRSSACRARGTPSDGSWRRPSSGPADGRRWWKRSAIRFGCSGGTT